MQKAREQSASSSSSLLQTRSRSRFLSFFSQKYFPRRAAHQSESDGTASSPSAKRAKARERQKLRKNERQSGATPADDGGKRAREEGERTRKLQGGEAAAPRSEIKSGSNPGHSPVLQARFLSLSSRQKLRNEREWEKRGTRERASSSFGRACDRRSVFSRSPSSCPPLRADWVQLPAERQRRTRAGAGGEIVIMRGRPRAYPFFNGDTRADEREGLMNVMRARARKSSRNGRGARVSGFCAEGAQWDAGWNRASRARTFFLCFLFFSYIPSGCRFRNRSLSVCWIFPKVAGLRARLEV